MHTHELSDWAQPADLPARTNGVVSLTMAKKLLRDRDRNGLAAAGAAAVVGKKGWLRVSAVLTYVLTGRVSVPEGQHQAA
jgi:hypothetical protein